MNLARIGVVVLLAVGAFLLFFQGMAGRGLVGPDEPRYAAIAREMQESGDWVTPRLSGEPWFEKPALLYWLGAASGALGLSDDRATRLPVALISVLFLAFFYRQVSREFGPRAAGCATLILASSAGWAAYSQVGIFDLPLAASVGAALLVLLPWVERSDEQTRRTLPWFGLLLGVSVLAKGLVGPAIAALALLSVCVQRGLLPVLRDLFHPRVLLPFGLVVLPWYGLCYAANGNAFVDDFFWRHHVERFTSDSIEHVKPFWYFLAVLPAGLLPWTPLLALTPDAKQRRDPRIQYLLTWILTTLLLFSASRNKLPGYVLPLFPAMAIWMGLSLSKVRSPRYILVAAAALLTLIPVAQAILPEAIARGLSKAWPPEDVSWLGVGAMLAIAAAVWWAASRNRTLLAVSLLAAGTVGGLACLKLNTFPALDRQAGTRALWRQVEPHLEETCIGQVRRHVVYGLRYYSHDRLPSCEAAPRPFRVDSDPAVFSGP
jgi:4-amino-4-deoxy-L-arabinose transferase-like glycosyltransferase